MAAKLTVRLTKLSEHRHRFAFIRADGSGGDRELESRSLLLHDLLHFAVETEAGLANGFYGGLAQGASLDDQALAEGDEALDVERVVGILTGRFKTPSPARDFVASVRAQMTETGTPPPPWFSPAFVESVDARLRALLGEWKAVRFGQTMTLIF